MLKRALILGLCTLPCAAYGAPSEVASDYVVKYVTRAEMPVACGRAGVGAGRWTSCTNPATATIYVDINAGPALAAYVIWAQLPALRAGRYAFTGDPETCNCTMPWAVAEEVAAKLNSREH